MMLRRFAWLGATRKCATRESVAACLDGWLQDWCLQHATLECAVSEVDLDARSAQEFVVWAIEPEGGSLLIALDKECLGALGGQFSMAVAEESDGVAADLARAALRELGCRLAKLAGSSGAEPKVIEGAWPEANTCAELGALALAFSFAGHEVLVAMDRTVVNALCPERFTPPPPPLASREESLGSSPIRLSAVLEFGSVSGREIAGLQAGEVLVSERAIGQPVEVRAGRRHVFDANLTRIDGHLAIVTTAPTSARENS